MDTDTKLLLSKIAVSLERIADAMEEQNRILNTVTLYPEEGHARLVIGVADAVQTIEL